jgi:probable F420-dependent oxidoreductase
VPKPRLAIGLSSAPHPGQDLRLLLDAARAVESAGLYGVSVNEHLAMGADMSHYVWGAGYPYAPDVPWLEPLTLISAMAAVTERIVFQTFVIIAPARPAVVLAKQAATLDVLSAGRFVLGVGTGWQPEELAAAGVPYGERGPRLTETIAACRALWRDRPASHHGEHIEFDDLYCEPRPTGGGVPVWFSGPLNGRQLRRVVELGDGWIPIMGSTPQEIESDVARLRQAMEEAGRGSDDLQIATHAPPSRDADGRLLLGPTLEAARALGDHGVTIASLSIGGLEPSLADLPALVEEIGRGWERL